MKKLLSVFAAVLLMVACSEEPVSDARSGPVPGGSCHSITARNITPAGPQITVTATDVPRGTFVFHVEHLSGRSAGYIQIPIPEGQLTETIAFSSVGYKMGVALCGSGIINERCNLTISNGSRVVEYENLKIGTLIEFTIE